MKPTKYYSTSNTNRARKILLFALVAVIIAGIVYTIAARALEEETDERLATVWVMCKPGDYINVRRTPSKNAMEVGRLDPCDSFLTDGTSSNGFIRAYGIGEYGEGWVYCGYVSIYEPKPVFETYACVAPNRVACRRWMDGPKTQNPWLKNGSTVQVFYLTEEWAVTSRGYIRSEWLEVSPQ